MTELEENLLPVDGTVKFIPGFFEAAQSTFFFEVLRDTVCWKQEPVRIMGREIMQPRLTAWYGDEGKWYRYSGITMQPLPWTTTLQEIREKVEARTGYSFNSVLLNFYRDGQDSMGWHRDNEKELGVNPVIASLSFGTPRNFRFRHIRDKKLKVEVILTHGSLLLMSGETQHNWQHALPKQPRNPGARLNLTFRRII